MRSPLIAEISRDKFEAYRFSEELQVRDLLEEDLTLLFELKVLNTDEIFWDKRESMV